MIRAVAHGGVRVLSVGLLALVCACKSPPETDPLWVDVYDPRAAAPGYQLTLYQRRTPLLLDLNGNTVHRWPITVTDRARLLPDGRLLAIGLDGAVREYDWDADVVWEYRLPGEDFPHHDLIRLENGNRLVLAHDVGIRLDYLVEVDDAGRVVWEWRAVDGLRADLARDQDRGAGGAHAKNRTHLNSMQELPPNRWFDGGDARFRPGNILISARNLSAIYVIDKATKEVVWRHDQGLDHQHEAAMIPRGHPGEGNIAFFNNGLEDRYGYRSSAVVEIDPSTGAEVWSYRAPDFFSSTGGTQQSLPNGHFLVSSSRGGRVFEVTREGRIVWQWTPRYLPMRDARYAYDHCPQLAALRRQAPLRVEPRARHHVDRDLYVFALPHQSRRRRIGDHERSVLLDPNVCRQLLLPERPELTLRFGFGAVESDADGEVVRTAVADHAAVVQASVRMAPAADLGSARVVFERELRSAPESASDPPPPFTEEHIDLREHGLESIELCFAAKGADGGPPDARFFWVDPIIRSARSESGDEDAGSEPRRGKAQYEKRLRALGYVD
jgi:hypothetical protein